MYILLPSLLIELFPPSLTIIGSFTAMWPVMSNHIHAGAQCTFYSYVQYQHICHFAHFLFCYNLVVYKHNFAKTGLVRDVQLVVFTQNINKYQNFLTKKTMLQLMIKEWKFNSCLVVPSSLIRSCIRSSPWLDEHCLLEFLSSLSETLLAVDEASEGDSTM